MNGGAAAAAAAAKRRAQQEEEELATYSTRDLAEDWEFKFVRSVTGRFRKPEELQRVLEEESRAGWQLVEKFDSSRIRLKRPASARANDAGLGIDPYRTVIGISEVGFALRIAGGVLAFFALVLLSVALLKK